MDAFGIFRQGLASVASRPPQQHNYFQKPRIPAPPPPVRDDPDSDSAHRTAHTLTACCRCRQRKTRCDPTLPRCSPCERSGSTCEYYDTTKGKKINRVYVVKLQETVRKLEKELKQYIDDIEDTDEAMVRPGGLVRLGGSDETPRYVGPSSGIAMTRLLMEEAKRYTDSKRIADLIPEIKKRREDRAIRKQSVVGSISGSSDRKKSYPMTSQHPAVGFPAKEVYDRLLFAFNERAHFFAPILHEKVLADDFGAVYAGDTDSYKNFVVRMVLAISLQKMEPKYAGLADSYYLAAMQFFEDVIRPKDIKTLQCLVLVAQYSLLTPTRTAVYYITGFATRICQQLGLNEEKTIGLGVTDPQALDMRRRLVWIATANELGLAHTMGRPSGFAKGNDHIDVKFFETVDDENITPDGIKPGPPSEKKTVAIHFCKMRLLQAEIRRTLYEAKRPEPNNDSHPWFSQMEQRFKEWLESAPQQPAWCKHWFTGRFHTFMITMYRPSPQVPKPSSRAATICFDGALYIINLSKAQVEKGAVDVTWVFMLVLYMALNALLWSISYPEVREKHPREEVEELVETAIDIIELCSDRWPGSASAAQLYPVIAKACMQSYNVKEQSLTPPVMTTDSGLDTPPSLADTSSPDSDSTATGSSSQQAHSQPAQMFNSPFGYVFSPEEMSTQYAFDAGPPGFFNRQPSFRSGSIFHSPGTSGDGRRGSCFPPDFTQGNDGAMTDSMDEATPPGNTMSQNNMSPPTVTMNTNSLPTPPESLAPPSANASNHLSPMSSGLRSASPTPTPTIRHASPVPMSTQASPMPPNLKFEHSEYSQAPFKPQGVPPPRAGAFTIPPPPQPHHQQRSAPTITDWFIPPPPFISPHQAFAGGGPPNPAFWGDNAAHPAFVGLGLTNNEGYTISGRDGTGADADFDMFANGSGFSMPYQYSERHGSLSQEQQMELMDVLDSEGMSDINTFLSHNMNMGGMGGGGLDPGVRWG